MTNREKFEQVFCIYATELWAMTAQQFIEWSNEEYNFQKKSEEKYERDNSDYLWS